jgi:hypothetical protein
MDYETYKKLAHLMNTPDNGLNISRVGQKGTFDYAAFQREYPSVFQQITAERTAAFSTFRQMPNYVQLLEGSIVAHSESWWKNKG